jgi:hypothetical protein
MRLDLDLAAPRLADRFPRLVVATVAVVVIGVTGARAESSVEPTPVGVGKPAESIGMSHKGQIQASLRLALGLRAIAPYNDEFCGQIDTSSADGEAAVCTGRAPFSLDFELGYGVARKIDLFLELRIGIESDFGSTATAMDEARVFHLSPGGRFFFSDSGKLKLFTTAQLVIDASGYKDVTGTGLGTDFGLRNMSGLWVDLDRAYGFYAFVGETATFARWLRFELEAGIGVQGRYR